MYIQPDTTVVLLRECPLDNTYEHTIFFSSEAAQYNYFYGLRKYTLTNQSYTRVNRGYIRVNRKSDDLYDCNYMMFQNSSYGNKWFYAFITSVEFINNVTCEVRFEIDEMQTWHFDYTLKECFVEREHSATDVIGENLIPEGLEQGEYIVSGEGNSTLGPSSTYSILVAATIDAQLDDAAGRIINSVYTGLNYMVFKSAEQLNAFILYATRENKADAIQGIYMCPFDFDSVVDGSNGRGKISLPKETKLGDYIPRNKKLLTYPYQLLHVFTDSGSADFRYEFFDGDSCTFEWSAYAVPTPSVTMRPTYYKTDAWSLFTGMEERLTITDFPQCAWTNDVYKAWLAQNTGALYSKHASSALSAVGGLIPAASSANQIGLASAAGSGTVSLITSITGEIGQRIDVASKPPQANGSQTSLTDYALGAKQFYFKNLCITKEFAQIIDDFFDMFGYATHRVKVPNRNVRPHWTYTKTKNCVLVGGVPSDSTKKICSIYNNGITFWKNGNEVGNYSLDNTV